MTRNFGLTKGSPAASGGNTSDRAAARAGVTREPNSLDSSSVGSEQRISNPQAAGSNPACPATLIQLPGNSSRPANSHGFGREPFIQDDPDARLRERVALGFVVVVALFIASFITLFVHIPFMDLLDLN